MSCTDCQKAEHNPAWGGFTGSCPHCQIRDYRNGPTYHAHMKNLKQTPASRDRRAYLETVERIEGKAQADALRSDYAQWWEASRAV